MNKEKIIAIIPSRFNSSRFPGKLLFNIAGKPLLEHTYRNSLLCKSLDEIFVATDSQKIKEHMDSLNAKVIMTSENCINGTERIVEAVKMNPFLQESKIIVNIQGDHPTINPKTIDAIVDLLKSDDQAYIATAVCPISYREAIFPDKVKCVFDQNNNALYFSRSAIPHSKTKETQVYHYHIGIYVYKTEFLMNYHNLKKSPLQEAEDLEQLKFLENGYKIKVAIVDEIPLGVDIKEDVLKVEKYLCQ